MHTHTHFHFPMSSITIGNISFELGWYSGRILELFSVTLLSWDDDKWFFTIFEIRALKFLVNLYYTDPEW